jgi:DNA-directed RNA polymerase specialized sigma24 family protein
MLGVARQVVGEHLRQRALEAAGSDDLLRTVEEPSAVSLDRLDLRQAMASLSEQERNRLALRYGRSRTSRSFSRRANSVETALHRAIGKLCDPSRSPNDGLSAAIQGATRVRAIQPPTQRAQS